MPDNHEETPSVERMKELLVGRRIVESTISDEKPDPWTSGPTGRLVLDDGTRVKLWGNEGGCACGAGDYPLEALNPIDGVITNVEIVSEPSGDGQICKKCGQKWCSHQQEDGHYTIFVVAKDERLELAKFVGDDGNGYYGTGWWLEVEAPTHPVAGNVHFGLT